MATSELGDRALCCCQRVVKREELLDAGDLQRTTDAIGNAGEGETAAVLLAITYAPTSAPMPTESIYGTPARSRMRLREVSARTMA
jgi:hypothetical protein